ncbi:aminotransferase class I/II-fold pyridoxal phosphate-dependent enzyme [Aerococcaceae bacterium zg-BR22]|uniref:aminotransferase class I/II-fold pyridoxal phosphate-dependent enzyme n=1 Tax=Aerococcaceae bacterium zg-1292 TaxID=2774330 RepID=UPI00406310E7|nr:aminotransferase class I/II-fold pyridoxal phosphate-dependent enzyme [Aerococcaceae bacterium zg-BR22]
MNINIQLTKLQPSPIRSFNDKISNIQDLIPLALGEPDFATPELIKQAGIDAINADLNGYTHSRGLLPLRQAISRYVKRKYQLDYVADTEIIVSAGPTAALFATLISLLNPGDKVITPSPNYVIYTTQVQLAHAELIAVDVSDTNFILTPEVLENTLKTHPQTKVILLNHPSNPTGVTYTLEQLNALVPLIEQYDLWVISDEIYAELTYDQKHVSFASLLPERTLLINGLSKSHAMTGWRSGFIAGPEALINQVFKVHQAMVNTPNSQMQYASIVAYDQGDEAIEEMKQVYKQRRDYLMDAFARLNIETLNPQGAFYLFVKVPDWFDGDDEAFCLALAHEGKVGVTPGSAFGIAGRQYFRMSYAASMEQLQAAMERIENFVRQHHV